jgi:hypothetical protein
MFTHGKCMQCNNSALDIFIEGRMHLNLIELCVRIDCSLTNKVHSDKLISTWLEIIIDCTEECKYQLAAIEKL